MYQRRANIRHDQRLKAVFVLTTMLLFLTSVVAGQRIPRALILTGNGNVPTYKEGYPPWIHDFHNEKVTEILQGITTVDVTSDLSVLRADKLRQYDLIISNSLFLTPDAEQLNALYNFVADGKSYLTLHCGILSLLNWNRYEEFIGGIFIGGPSSVPAQFKVHTSNTMFWGYEYSFRKEQPHPVSVVTDDFEIKDELYHIQPGTRDFYVIARAENLPVMWWHPVGKGKVMSLTLGHDEEAKNNPGYQNLLRHGVQWLTGIPLIVGDAPRVVSNRNLRNENFMTLTAATSDKPDVTFQVIQNSNPDVFKAEASGDGKISLSLSGKPGSGNFVVQARQSNGLSSTKTFEIHVVPDGEGNIASYQGNTATCSSNENQSGVFDAANIIDGDSSTRWSSAPTDTAWVVADLQKTYTVSRIVIAWEESFATEYKVLGSEDGRQWRTLREVVNGDGSLDEFRFPPSQVRYIKVLGTERANEKWGYSIYELKIYQ